MQPARCSCWPGPWLGFPATKTILLFAVDESAGAAKAGIIVVVMTPAAQAMDNKEGL